MIAMEFKIIEDKQTWENFLERQENRSMFLSWNWAEFEQIMGSDFRTFGIFDGEKLVGVLPIKTVRARRGMYLHVRHAPVIDWMNAKLAVSTKDFLVKFARKQKVDFVRISPLVEKNLKNEEALRSLGFKPATTHSVDAELTLVIDLSQTEEEMLKNMRKQTRYYIRQAEKMGIEVKQTDGIEYWNAFMKIHSDTVARQKWTAYSEKYMRIEYDIFRRDRMARMFVSFYKGQPISSAIFIYYGGQSVYHHSGSLSQFRSIPSTYLLQWEAVKYAKQRGLKFHNLWGVSPEGEKKHPWYGLSLFKRGFGGQEVEFIHAQDLVVRPWAHVTRTFELVEKKLRGY
jgi:lipid II:glycine glycyltransferase (peptidoglycan interpeptide bridge formation enzyme)